MWRFCRDLREEELEHCVDINLEKNVFNFASSPGFCLNRLEFEYRMANIGKTGGSIYFQP